MMKILWTAIAVLGTFATSNEIFQEIPDEYSIESSKCGIKIIHKCECGENGTLQEVYVDSCSRNISEDSVYDCTPCPGVCFKFKFCKTCSLNQCLTCPLGKAGAFCELNDLKINQITANTTQNETMSTVPNLEASILEERSFSDNLPSSWKNITKEFKNESVFNKSSEIVSENNSTTAPVEKGLAKDGSPISNKNQWTENENGTYSKAKSHSFSLSSTENEGTTLKYESRRKYSHKSKKHGRYHKSELKQSFQSKRNKKKPVSYNKIINKIGTSKFSKKSMKDFKSLNDKATFAAQINSIQKLNPEVVQHDINLVYKPLKSSIRLYFLNSALNKEHNPKLNPHELSLVYKPFKSNILLYFLNSSLNSQNSSLIKDSSSEEIFRNIPNTSEESESSSEEENVHSPINAFSDRMLQFDPISKYKFFPKSRRINFNNEVKMDLLHKYPSSDKLHQFYCNLLLYYCLFTADPICSKVFHSNSYFHDIFEPLQLKNKNTKNLPNVNFRSNHGPPFDLSYNGPIDLQTHSKTPLKNTYHVNKKIFFTIKRPRILGSPNINDKTTSIYNQRPINVHSKQPEIHAYINPFKDWVNRNEYPKVEEKNRLSGKSNAKDETSRNHIVSKFDQIKALYNNLQDQWNSPNESFDINTFSKKNEHGLSSGIGKMFLKNIIIRNKLSPNVANLEETSSDSSETEFPTAIKIGLLDYNSSENKKHEYFMLGSETNLRKRVGQLDEKKVVSEHLQGELSVLNSNVSNIKSAVSNDSSEEIIAIKHDGISSDSSEEISAIKHDGISSDSSEEIPAIKYDDGSSGSSEEISAVKYDDDSSSSSEEIAAIKYDGVDNASSEEIIVIPNNGINNASSEEAISIKGHFVITNSSEEIIEIPNHGVNNASSEEIIAIKGHFISTNSSEEIIEITDHDINNASSKEIATIKDHSLHNASEEITAITYNGENKTSEEIMVITTNGENNTSGEEITAITYNGENNASSEEIIAIKDHDLNNSSSEKLTPITDYDVNNYSSKDIAAIKVHDLNNISSEKITAIIDHGVNNASSKDIRAIKNHDATSEKFNAIKDRNVSNAFSEEITARKHHKINNAFSEEIDTINDHVLNNSFPEKINAIKDRDINNTASEEIAAIKYNDKNNASSAEIIATKDPNNASSGEITAIKDHDPDEKNRSRRSVDDEHVEHWCPLVRQTLNGNLECKAWEYQKECQLKCHQGYTSVDKAFICLREVNVWMPPISPCEKIEDYDPLLNLTNPDKVEENKIANNLLKKKGDNLPNGEGISTPKHKAQKGKAKDTHRKGNIAPGGMNYEAFYKEYMELVEKELHKDFPNY